MARTGIGLQTKIVATLFVLTVVPLILVWANTLRVLDRVGDRLVAETRAKQRGLIAEGEAAIEDLLLANLAAHAHFVASRLAAHIDDAPGDEVRIDPADERLRRLAVEPIAINGFSMVYDRAGTVLLHRDRSEQGTSLKRHAETRPAFWKLIEKSFGSPVTGAYGWPGPDGDPSRWMLAAERVEPYDLIVAAMVPRDDWIGPLSRIIQSSFLQTVEELGRSVEQTRVRLRYQILLFFALVAGVVLFAGSRLAGQITRPVRELTEAVRSVGAGELRTIVGVDQRDEIGALARAFVRMKRDIKIYREQIEDKQRALTAANAEISELNRDLEEKIRERTRELELALEELKSLDKNKDDFIALVSHELRTPLTSIMATTEAMLKGGIGADAEERERLLGMVQEESQRLSRLIADVLQVQRMETGRMPFAFKRINLVSLAEKARINASAAASRKGITLHSESAADARLRSVPADYDRLMQVMTNLLSNAIKFTPAGGDVRIEVTAAEDPEGDAGREVACVSVFDTGIGISEKDAKKVFDRFYQAERIDHHSEGSGLGLPIARHIVEEHGGRIWYEPGEDGGSAFRFVLPLERE